MPNRKRALTGLESAEQQERDLARARRREERLATVRQDVADLREQIEQERSQYYNDVAEEYH
jgi:hypothetical protein